MTRKNTDNVKMNEADWNAIYQEAIKDKCFSFTDEWVY